MQFGSPVTNLLNIVHVFRYRCLIIWLIKLWWSPASEHKYLCFGCLCWLSVCVPHLDLDTIIDTADQWGGGIQLTILIDSEIRSTWNIHNKNECKDVWLYLDASRAMNVVPYKDGSMNLIQYQLTGFRLHKIRLFSIYVTGDPRISCEAFFSPYSYNILVYWQPCSCHYKPSIDATNTPWLMYGWKLQQLHFEKLINSQGVENWHLFYSLLYELHHGIDIVCQYLLLFHCIFQMMNEIIVFIRKE